MFLFSLLSPDGNDCGPYKLQMCPQRGSLLVWGLEVLSDVLPNSSTNQKHSTGLEKFQSRQGLAPLHFGTAACFQVIRGRMLSQNPLVPGLPSSGNDSQNPNSDQVIPSQGYIQTSYLVHGKGKVVSYSEMRDECRLRNQTKLGPSASFTTYWLCDLSQDI